jgi:predicted SAM-dependent methyltransferase
MIDRIKQVLKKFHLYLLISGALDVVRFLIYSAKRGFGLVDRQTISAYIKQHEIRKLHVGCGNNVLDGWLNSNYYPEASHILHLDATESFPMGNDEFDYIFSEHMIEHISHADGLLMLNECFRLLKPDGKIRISTPNLLFLVDLYKPDKSALQLEYIKWATDRFIPNVGAHEDTYVINNFVRDWGHSFIYDEKTLRLSLEKAGFTNITKCELNQSDRDVFRNLENESRLPPGFLKLETISLEGTKSN